MRILNLMFGKGRGGIEQAALDYHEALTLAGHEVCSVLHHRAAMVAPFAENHYQTTLLSPHGEWDIIAALRLRALAKRHAADLVIAHGNRAIGLALRALKGRIPVVGVAHNYQIKRLPRCDAAFCITRDLMEELVHLNMSRSRLFHIPNLVRAQAISPLRRAFRSPPVIGTMGRFVAKKGFAQWIDSLSLLRQQSVEFRAILGGGGPLDTALREQSRTAGLDDWLSFSGWVEDKTAFYDSIDLFVLPSHHEPFGIVLIEAMAHGLPCITTATEGPCEIVHPHEDALLVDEGNAFALSQAMAQCLADPLRAAQMGEQARRTVERHYDLPIISAQLHRAAMVVTTRLAAADSRPISLS